MSDRPDAEPASAPVPPAPVAAPLDAAERNERLRRLAGPGECSAALLALLLTPGSRREKAVWRELCRGIDGAEEHRRLCQTLRADETLPWLERMATMLARQPLEHRQALLQGARRLMAADGRIGVPDRLRWLLLRHLLGERPALAQLAGEARDLTELDEHAVLLIGVWTAFLARLVPVPEVDVDLFAAELPEAPGPRWWHSVMSLWPERPVFRVRVDTDATAAALAGVQALPWMLRPVLVRRWFDHALAFAPEGTTVHPLAAEALRISARLLDSPLPPTLAACFVEIDAH